MTSHWMDDSKVQLLIDENERLRKAIKEAIEITFDLNVDRLLKKALEGDKK